MPRGRLIFPFLAELALYRPDLTVDADPDGAGPLELGLDDVFREPALVAPAEGSAPAARAREEEVVQLPAQVAVDVFERLQMLASGMSPEVDVTLTFHFRDLERLGLVDADGRALVRPRDRLVAIYDKRGTLVERVPTPPGLYCVEAKSRSFGLGAHRNLLVATFRPREVAGG